MQESEALFKDILSSPFDFNKDEEFNSDYKNLPYVKNKKQLKDRWRLQLKYATIANFDDLKKENKRN